MNLIILLLSQPIPSYDRSFPDFESFWDSYSDNRISSYACGSGYTGIANSSDLSGTFINPASLSLKKKQFYLEYVYKKDIEWLADIKYKNLNPNFSVGFGLPISNYLQIGITYRTENSLKADYGETPWTVVDESVEEGFTDLGSLNAYKDIKISSYSLPVVFKLSTQFSVGVDLSYTNFYSNHKSYGIVNVDTLIDSTWIESNNINASFSKIRPKFGIIVCPIENLSLGLTYLPETREFVTVDFGDTTITYTQPNIFPWKIGVGISYKLNNIPLELSLDYKYSRNSEEENLVNRKDIHFGLDYDINNHLAIRTGLFTQMDYRSSSSQNSSAYFGLGNYTQIFTTLGFSYKISSLVLNLSLMDSHLFSNSPIEQTYFSTGISYDF